MTKKLMVLGLVLAMILSMTVVFAEDATSSASVTTETPAETPSTAPSTNVGTPSTYQPATPAVVEETPTERIEAIARVLSFGSTGTDVEALQKWLTKVGYTLDIDGSFGPLTLTAVKAFQKDQGLTADGIFGPKTNAALYLAADGTDTVTTASIVADTDAFESAIGSEGTWIIATLKDMETEDELVLDGQFYNGKTDSTTGEPIVQRKIALYTQDDDHNVTASFSLKAPKLTVLSPNARIQSGTFIGDVYVSAENFELKRATVDGNVYFTTQAAKDTFIMDDESKITGYAILMEPDVVTSASIVNDMAAFENGISEEGAWIIATVQDLWTDDELVLTGDFLNSRGSVQRKIALYSQDDAHNITRQFTLTAPKLTVLSPNARIQGGIFKGDVYVSSENFQLVKATVDGNIYFMTQAAKDTFTMDDMSAVTGQLILTEADAVTTASIVRTADDLEASILNDGQWITAIVNDVTTDQPLYMVGSFVYKDITQRKLALYSQDEAHNITRQFTLTAPELVVGSPNARVEKGIFKGDIYVTAPNFKLNVMTVEGNVYVSGLADGFTVVGTTINGNVYFATQAVMDSASFDDASTVTGEIALQ